VRDLLWNALFAAPHADAGELLEHLWVTLAAAGVPVRRATVALRTLHPEIVGLGYVWEAGRALERNEHPHGELALARFRDSPFRHLFEGGAPLHIRIEGDGPLPFPVLHELRARGFTDYLALPLAFVSGQVHALTVASDRPGGFSDEHALLFRELAPALAAALDVRETRRVARTLLATYLGSRAGDEVLEGNVRRGDVAMIDAIVLSCDMRGFTSLSLGMTPADVVALLNEYFDRVCTPIVDAGGEVLKFMGDGMLSILPLRGEDAPAACATALRAARAAVNEVEQRPFGGDLALRMGLALHLGPVAFGNVGSRRRLDFTVIGPTVNLASRLAGMCGRLERALLVSSAFAAMAPDGARSLGVHQVRGLPDAEEVFTYEA
jgi:adenylate cyclase